MILWVSTLTIYLAIILEVILNLHCINNASEHLIYLTVHILSSCLNFNLDFRIVKTQAEVGFEASSSSK